MPDIPICNETNYELAPWILDCVRDDVIGYFGESVRAIRLQIGISRHVFHTKTHEVRYAFFPDEYGLSCPPPPSFAANTDGPGILRDRDYRDVFRPFALTYDADEADDADEIDTAYAVLDGDIDGVAHDPDAEFQGLDPDFDTIDTSDQSFLNESRDVPERE